MILTGFDDWSMRTPFHITAFFGKKQMVLLVLAFIFLWLQFPFFCIGQTSPAINILENLMLIGWTWCCVQSYFVAILQRWPLDVRMPSVCSSGWERYYGSICVERCGTPPTCFLHITDEIGKLRVPQCAKFTLLTFYENNVCFQQIHLTDWQTRSVTIILPLKKGGKKSVYISWQQL